MANPYYKSTTFSPEVANSFMEMQKGLIASIDSRSRSNAKPQGAREKQVRVARTVTVNHAYPTGHANKYEVELGSLTINSTTVGLETPTFVPYTGGKNIRIACLKNAIPVPVGTIVWMKLVHGDWWITSGVATRVVGQLTASMSTTIGPHTIDNIKGADAASLHSTLSVHNPHLFMAANDALVRAEWVTDNSRWEIYQVTC